MTSITLIERELRFERALTIAHTFQEPVSIEEFELQFCSTCSESLYSNQKS